MLAYIVHLLLLIATCHTAESTQISSFMTPLRVTHEQFILLVLFPGGAGVGSLFQHGRIIT
jgi:hypothetical protein